MRPVEAEAYDRLLGHCDPRFFTSPDAATAYLTLHASRFVDTVQSIRPVVTPACKILEIGARPYLLSVLVRQEFQATVDAVNDGPEEDFQGIHSYGLNIESSKVPRPDGYYDLILLCEVLEHLLDPSSALVETNRLLRAGGYLFVSTPNAVSFGIALTLLAGRNVYGGFSRTSPYGRHNREYTYRELQKVLPAFGFSVTHLWNRNYRDLRGHTTPRLYQLTTFAPNRRHRLDLLAQKVGAVTDRFPACIYRTPHVEYRD